ncbi:hypothetical protein ACWCOV_00040 [Kribbella sp. NPDC002412]
MLRALVQRSARDDVDQPRTAHPWIGPDHVSAGPALPEIWSPRRFTELVLGEIRRLRDDADGYGPRGRNFIDHVEIPPEVLAAYNHLAAEHPGLIRQ